MPTAGPVIVVLPGRAWQDQAACRDLDPELFTVGEREGEDAPHLQDAITICHRCPVEAECLAYALAVEEPSGVWGGKLTAEREGILAARRRSA